jgi:hypothetical protein
MVVAGTVVAPAAYGQDVTIPVTTTVISSSTGESRVLIAPATPVDATTWAARLVVSATVQWDLPGLVPAAPMDLLVYALDKTWSSQDVTWDYPWSKPGGDPNDTYPCRSWIVDGKAASSLLLDVTPIIRGFAEGELADNGLLLTVGASDRLGFSAAESLLLGSLTKGTLTISYRDRPKSLMK